MKLIRHGERGAEKPGLVDANGTYRDLSGKIDDLSGDVLGDLSRLANVNASSLPEVSADTRLGPCVGGTGKFMCIGLNYSDHAAESGMDVPPEPVLFMKATSAICGPNDPILIPRGSTKTDWEVELGVVIGRAAKYVSEADALDHVAGYCVINDVSERAFQAERAGQWTKGKSCDNFGQTGPWLVTPDEVGDPQALRMWLKVNGETRQDGSTGDDGLRRGASRLVSQPVLHAPSRRHHLDRHAARRRARHEAAAISEGWRRRGAGNRRSRRAAAGRGGGRLNERPASIALLPSGRRGLGRC